MAITTSYLTSTKNVPAFFDSLIGAKAPAAFTQKFIEGLGFKSTNDRLFLSVLKGLGFLDQAAVPTERYYKFLDQTESKKVLAEAIESSYEDLFAVKKNAYDLTNTDVRNKLRTLTQGKYSDDVISKMAGTFKALCEYADWGVHKGTEEPEKNQKNKDDQENTDEKKEEKSENPGNERKFDESKSDNFDRRVVSPDFHYNIQIHLPDSRDEAVYDAIFKSLKKHIL